MTTEARREQLLSFGREHFAEHGYQSMPMDAIAEHAGVSKGLLYHYFGNQRGFYIETVRGVIDELIAITEPPPGKPFEQAFRIMMTEFVDYVETHRGIYTALVRGGLGSDEEVNELLDLVRATSSKRILDLLAVHEPTELAQIAMYGWVSLVENACAEWALKDGSDSGPLIDFFISAFRPVVAVLHSTGER